MKQSSLDLSLILPCYNESGLFMESVERIVSVLQASKLSYEIIFVDDASRDITPELIASVCRKNHAMKAVYHTRNKGRGQTVMDGIYKARATIVGYIDIDCEVSPVYIPSIVAQLLQNTYDVVIGKRFYRTSPRAVLREILSRGYQWLSDMLIGTGGMDTETGYKFFQRKKILPILSKTRNTGWFWDTEIMVYARRAGLRITETPVLFLRRFDKISSVNIFRDTLDYMIQLLAFRKRLRI